MISLKRKQTGFTIVELLIVIVVIGILAALVVTTFAGIQKKARNTERETDVKAIHGQLEAYFSENNTYPTRDNLNDAGWRGTNMRSLDGEALKDPQGTAQTLADSPAAKTYSYEVTCDTSTPPNCTAYTLTATKEDAANFVKENLN